MAEMQDKLSSTGEGLSDEDSHSSLPETECDWPYLDITVHDTASLAAPVLEASDAVGVWPMPPPPEAPPFLPSLDMGPEQTCQFEACFYQVAYLGGIEVRAAPDFDAPRTGLVLMQNDVLAVSQQFAGTDGRIYLGLADGQGWIFDDSALVPHDPSVVQLQYTGLQPQQMSLPWDYQGIGPMLATGTEAVLPQPLSLPGLGCIAPPPPVPPPPLAPPTVNAVPCGELLASTPAIGVASPQPAPLSWFRVSYLGGINLRCGPSIESPMSGFILQQMETFPVAEEFPGQDGRIYLRLCDGRGWAFDDTALMPHDPSVKRGNWLQPQPSNHLVDTRVLQEVQTDALSVRRHRMHPQPRGKRGGKRCSRRSQTASASAGAIEGG